MISNLLGEIEETISLSSIVISSDIKKYFSASKKDLYIKGLLIFMDMSSLEFSVFVLEKGKRLIFDKYKNYCQHTYCYNFLFLIHVNPTSLVIYFLVSKSSIIFIATHLFHRQRKICLKAILL